MQIKLYLVFYTRRQKHQLGENSDRCTIGVARIFFLGVHFSWSKSWRPFLVGTLKTQAKSTKLTTPSPTSPQFSKKIALFLCLGVHLQLFPVKLATNFSPPWGCTPWPRLCGAHTASTWHICSRQAASISSVGVVFSLWANRHTSLTCTCFARHRLQLGLG